MWDQNRILAKQKNHVLQLNICQGISHQNRILNSRFQPQSRVRSRKVEKEYYVQVDGEITKTAIDHLKNGIESKM